MATFPNEDVTLNGPDRRVNGSAKRNLSETNPAVRASSIDTRVAAVPLLTFAPAPMNNKGGAAGTSISTKLDTTNVLGWHVSEAVGDCDPLVSETVRDMVSVALNENDSDFVTESCVCVGVGWLSFVSVDIDGESESGSVTLDVAETSDVDPV